MSTLRIDQWLVQRGLVASRERAGELIRKGAVQVNGKVIIRPGIKFDENAQVELLEAPFPWVSRGALKLLSALEQFKVSATDRTCLDVGASTGGFTEVLLHHGAKKVFALDAGTDQLAERLRSDERIVSIEKQNIRTAPDDLLGEAVSLVVINISFISLKLILHELRRFLAPSADVIALVKPQFEVGATHLGRGGIVRNEKRRIQAVNDVVAEAKNLGFTCAASTVSPIEGGDGNIEYLIHLQWQK
jgi:23S rRNA (cytidine1920-2'-O)/16S rRNA (cytidine1409-2'-O)-methyltransferase